MIVNEIKCDICNKAIVYKDTVLLKGIKVYISLFKSVHLCECCMKEIKEKVLKKDITNGNKNT